MNWNRPIKAAAFALVMACAAVGHAAPKDYFGIHLVDEDTGRGVPLTYMRSVYKQMYISDSAGYVAFNEPGLMDGKTDVWFDVKSYGYEELPGAFGVHGIGLKPTAGGSVTIKLKRKQIAERLYRMTGYGIYRDSVMLGIKPPIKEGLLNAQVTGSDTVQCAEYRGKLMWMWQDTDRVGFELGNFSMTGAVTELPSKIDPNKGLEFTYFSNKPGEFAKQMAVVPREGTNPIWVDGLTVVPDEKGRERMVGKYIAANKDFSPAEAGILVYNDEKNVLERLTKFEGPRNGSQTPGPTGHVIYLMDGKTRYAWFGNGLRVKADFASVSDPKQYEAFTCLKSDGTANRENGKLVWQYVKGAKPVHGRMVDDLIKRNIIKPEEAPVQLKDVDSGNTIHAAGGGVAWNAYLKQWVFIFGQQGGTSNLGEIWMSTAKSPEGPWINAKKVATHAMKDNNNDLYNVVQHYELAQKGGQEIFFSGTFVISFSGNKWPTPYYNYNNLVYKLDLSDPRTKLPEPPPGLSKATSDEDKG
ncbi:MAG: signal peptide protein [Phycisphaerales bacterium]|nr:signal peptide protein [Phycisphaerales bacterium]